MALVNKLRRLIQAKLTEIEGLECRSYCIARYGRRRTLLLWL